MKHRSLKIREIFPVIWARLVPHRKVYFISLLLGLCGTFLMMATPYVSELYFNMLDDGRFRSVRTLLIISIVVFMVLNFASILGMYLKQIAVGKLNRDFMVEMADEAQRLPLERAQSSHSSDLVQRASQDVKKTTSILTSIIDGIGNSVIMFLLGITYMMLIHWQVGLVVLIISPTILFGSHLLRYRLQKIGRAVTEQEAIVRQCQQDILQGIETIKAFGVGDFMRERFVSERAKLNQLQLKRMWWQQAVSSTTHVIASVIEVGVLFVLGWLAITSTMTLGAIVAAFTLVYRVVGPMNAIGREWGSLQKNVGASLRTFALWRAEKEPFLPAESYSEGEIFPVEHDLRLKQVSFRYEERAGLGDHDVFGKTDDRSNESNERDTLQRFDLRVEQGSFTALVGPSGAGKSTVAKLAAGLLFPQQGEVVIAGLNTAVHAEKARESIAYVPQTPYLFAGTIKENLQLANESASDEEVKRATQWAQADEFIESFPNGLDTDIKELGSSLSGGQRQRIAIARALASAKSIIILDEATSALDFQTERQVMDHIREQARKNGQTLLVIAHRLSTIMDADDIIVMRDGMIHEQGKHAELLRDENGLYHQLWGQLTSNEG